VSISRSKALKTVRGATSADYFSRLKGGHGFNRARGDRILSIIWPEAWIVENNKPAVILRRAYRGAE
jgi:hypothetical protein